MNDQKMKQKMTDANLALFWSLISVALISIIALLLFAGQHTQKYPTHQHWLYWLLSQFISKGAKLAFFIIIILFIIIF